jgi:hypothetical protein
MEKELLTVLLSVPLKFLLQVNKYFRDDFADIVGFKNSEESLRAWFICEFEPVFRIHTCFTIRTYERARRETLF